MNYSTSLALTENATLETNNPARIDMPAYASETSPSLNRSHSQPPTNNKNLLKWIEKMAALTQPAVIHWVDGSQAEYETLCAEMVAGETLIKLNEELWPGCYAKSDPSDVARVEDRTYICSLSKDNAGRQTIGSIPSKCVENSRRSSMAACADAP
jgi:GTP-dependent phosphoenolpyruvate carboxykinase